MSVVLGSTIDLLVVHPELSIEHPSGDRSRTDMNIVHADFDRSILEQIDEKYDIIALDWNLESPDARGIVDTTRQYTPDTKVLALTADVPETDPVDRGADEFLVQPVSDEELYGAIERLALQKEYEHSMSEFFRLATERALLQTELDSEADVSDRYDSVTRELQECREDATAIRDELSSEEFDRTLRQLFDE